MLRKTLDSSLIFLVLAAIVSTAATVKREVLRRQPGTMRPIDVPDWKEYAAAGARVGATRAAVSVVIFSDYECPFCRRLNAQIDRILAARPDVEVVFRHFPLAGHANARPAARAAICGDQQGRFRLYNDKLFGQSSHEADWDFIGLAATLAMDTTSFRRCFEGLEADSLLDADIRAGIRLGVDGTPGILVNNQLFLGLPGDLRAIVRAAKPSRM